MAHLNDLWRDWLLDQSVDMPDNSTSENINTGSTFTGEWQKVPVGSNVYLTVKADQDLEMSLQWSPDGVNQDSTITRHYHTDGRIEPPHVFTHARPYFRLVVSNNSGTNTSTCRVNTYTVMGGAPLNVPVDGTVAQDYDATVVRPTDFHTEVALGRRQGVSLWNKFGYNNDVDIGTEVIAAFGGTFQYLTAGETIDIVSSSAADDGDPAGTGVNSIVIYGIDENWDEQIEVVTMNGTTTVTTTSQWIGINRVAIFLSGSGDVNAGNITVTATTSGYNMAYMPAGEGVTQQLIYYVPRNHQFLAEWLIFDALKTSGGGNPEIIYKGWVYSAVNQSKQEVYRGKMDVQNSNSLPVSTPLPFPVGEKSILWFEATTDTNNTQVSGRFSGEQFRNKAY